MPTSNTILLQVSEEAQNEIQKLQIQVKELNELKNKDWDSNYWNNLKIQENNVKSMVESFNKMQLCSACSYGKVVDVQLLLPSYLRGQLYIQASLRKTTINLNDEIRFITYRYKSIGFSEFIKKQNGLQEEVKDFQRFFSSVAYCVYENLKHKTNVEYSAWMSCEKEENPYTKCKGYVDEKAMKTVSGIAQCMYDRLSTISSECIKPVSEKMARLIIINVAQSRSVDCIIDRLIWAYVYELNGKRWCEVSDFENNYFVGRHVGRCAYRQQNKTCRVFDQPCHSSEDCAFYQEKKEEAGNRWKTTFFDDED